tara:strand:- start:1263 stop:1571 length:309 start_codon:yes stop_codon:yes gene_type:complete
MDALAQGKLWNLKERDADFSLYNIVREEHSLMFEQTPISKLYFFRNKKTEETLTEILHINSENQYCLKENSLEYKVNRLICKKNGIDLEGLLERVPINLTKK